MAKGRIIKRATAKNKIKIGGKSYHRTALSTTDNSLSSKDWVVVEVYNRRLKGKKDLYGTTYKPSKFVYVLKTEMVDGGVAKERKYTSQQPHEQAYKKKRKSKVVSYKTKKENGGSTYAGGGEIKKEKSLYNENPGTLQMNSDWWIQMKLFAKVCRFSLTRYKGQFF